jgi:hypothetical protein
MKQYLFSTFFMLVLGTSLLAQEKYSNALNVGVGIGGYSGYYSYVEQSLPVFHVNYEFDVAKNFTLAPFIGFFSYKKSYYYGSPGQGYKYYDYRETVLPIGAKGFYYFDNLVEAGGNWDFYVAGSLGFVYSKMYWDKDYPGDRDYYRRGRSVFLDLHVGTEYHFNSKVGAFLDLSNGVSTIGLAFHSIK